MLYRHGLRGAMTPVVTQFGIDVGTLLGGAIVTETVFGLPGLGQLAVQSVASQDLPVIIGIVLVAAVFIVVANILVDLAYAVLDPRVRRVIDFATFDMMRHNLKRTSIRGSTSDPDVAVPEAASPAKAGLRPEGQATQDRPRR